MDDLLGKLASAIAEMEGWWKPGSLPGKNHNPGDLRAAPWLPKAVIVNKYWVAENDAQGIAGLYHQIALNVARGYSLRKLIQAWAPASDGNNPGAYLRFVQARCEIINPDEPLQNFLELHHS
jgi:hypothetical protein